METGSWKIRVALLLLGANATAVQVLFLREFISASYGNELVIGIVLACWMVLTGLGAFLGGRIRKLSPATLLVFLAVVPSLLVILLRALRNVVVVAGSMAGLGDVSVAALLLLSPFCIVSGYTFIRCAAALGPGQAGKAGAFAYTWESVGSIAGGLVFNVLLVRIFDIFQILALLATTTLLLVVPVFREPLSARKARTLLLVAVIVICAGVEFSALDRWTTAMTYPGQELVYSKGTPYGTLTVTRQQEQLNFYEDHALMFSTGDVVANEENVHYALLQHPSPTRVLLIGGGIAGITREVLKYPVEHVDYLEQNPWILEVGQRFTAAFTDSRMTPIHADARMYLRTTDVRYDAVLVNLPDPSTVQVNRYYTLEFFQEAKQHLRNGGVVAVALLPFAEYRGDESRLMQSTVYATLRRVFSNVLIVPGSRYYFLASDTVLDIHVTRLVERRNIANLYVNSYYIDDTMLAARSAALTAGLPADPPPNTDDHPVCTALQLSYWSRYFGTDPIPWITAGVILSAALLFWQFRPVGSAILASGFAASSSEIVLLTAFQALYGSLYEMTGMLITTFMAGLALGAHLSGKNLNRASFFRLAFLEIAVAVICILLPLLFTGLRDLASTGGTGIVLVATLLIAALTGAEFPLAVALKSTTGTDQVSSPYGLDLLGSAAGALLTGIYVIPAVGIAQASYISAAVSAAGASICLLGVRRSNPTGALPS